jgi:hypothetical protein
MLVVLACILSMTAVAGDGAGVVLPAYAHNDYRNERPLERAIELGFQGVEVDYYVEDGELRVGHDPDETRPGRTVESMYLIPLRERVRREGTVLPGGRTFILNVESKREGMSTYEALHELLSRYEDMLTVVRDGRVEPGPVQVILVGWYPPLDYLARQPVRYTAVQLHYEDLADDHERYPSHLVKLIRVFTSGVRARCRPEWRSEWSGLRHWRTPFPAASRACTASPPTPASTDQSWKPAST